MLLLVHIWVAIGNLFTALSNACWLFHSDILHCVFYSAVIDPHGSDTFTSDVILQSLRVLSMYETHHVSNYVVFLALAHIFITLLPPLAISLCHPMSNPQWRPTFQVISIYVHTSTDKLLGSFSNTTTCEHYVFRYLALFRQ